MKERINIEKYHKFKRHRFNKSKNFKIKSKNIRKNFKAKIIKLLFIFVLLLFYIFLLLKNNPDSPSFYVQDDVTLVTTLFKLPTPRHKFSDYIPWIEKLLQVNKPIVFFIQKNLSEMIKPKRPKIYDNKTIWIELDFSELYFNKYKKEFEQTYLIDGHKFRHNIFLFIIWSEKLKFLERAINANYFKSNYFFWIDAGFLRDKKNISIYLNNWPSVKKLKEDPRVLMNEVKKFSKEVYEKLVAFDAQTHEMFKNNFNMAGNFFGGRQDYIIKFFNYYYEVFKLFIKKGKFIGMDQNLYAIVAYLHPEVIKVVHLNEFSALRDYLID